MQVRLLLPQVRLLSPWPSRSRVGTRKHHALPSSFEITFKELSEALMSNFAAGERKTPEETLFERQTKLQAAVQQTNTSIAGFKSELVSMKREGRAAGRAAGHQMSLGKIKNLKTLANQTREVLIGHSLERIVRTKICPVLSPS